MNNKIFRTNGILRGRFTMSGNVLLEREDIPKYEEWTLDNIAKDRKSVV